MFRFALAALAAIVLVAASLVPDDAFARRGEVVLVSVVVEVASTGVAALTSEAAPFTQDVFMPEAGIAEAFDRRIR